MARGRKQKGNEKKSEIISFRITKKHKEILNKNKWIREEIKNDLLKYLDDYLQ